QSQEHPPKWKYLRVCGEESASGSPVMIGMEIPPRVRRRAHSQLGKLMYNGKYLRVCGEERHHSIKTARHGEYLRVCGEEGVKVRCGSSIAEIPPRVRRRVLVSLPVVRSRGNTSACAEKRIGSSKSMRPLRKYLRVCGEERPVF